MLNVAALKAYIKKQFKRILYRKSARYFRHGDAGVKNIFYDPETDRTVLIDVARIHYWIDNSGHPLADNVADFFHLHRTMMDQAGELTQDERHQLNVALCGGYVGFSDSRMNLYNALKAISNCVSPDDPAEQCRQNALFQLNVHTLKESLWGTINSAILLILCAVSCLLRKIDGFRVCQSKRDDPIDHTCQKAALGSC